MSGLAQVESKGATNIDTSSLTRLQPQLCNALPTPSIVIQSVVKETT